MENSVPLAIVGLGSILPDAPDVATFWTNLTRGRSSISDVPADRWDPAFYYDPDPRAPDKTYSKIGGWVRDAAWDPVKWHLPIPPRVSASMDGSQRWAIACTVQALGDYGYPARPLDLERTAVILGNAMGGELHYRTALRVAFPEVASALAGVPGFAGLPSSDRLHIINEWQQAFQRTLPEITEDSMPGELSNCIAGRLANLFNFRGPNYIVDAACASAIAAVGAAAKGLAQGEFDVAITGGVDRNMGASSFIKFSKIGALSATGSRPYADGADGFVMGEGCVLFVLKRLADAERDGDRIYAVLLAIGASSDGKGKGITAPNPIGQQLAIGRAWRNAGVPPAGVGLVEGHGTSTAVGDVVEVESLTRALGAAGLRPASVALGSVKSNIGHLKAAAGGAGLLKVVLALHEKVLPPSINCTRPNHNIDFTASPFFVNTEAREWIRANGAPRRACASAFGFGGTNFHCVLEEYVEGNRRESRQVLVSVPEPASADTASATAARVATPALPKAPLRGALVIGAASVDELRDRLLGVRRDAAAGHAPAPAPPSARDLRAAERIAIDYGSAPELAERAGRAVAALDSPTHGTWKALRSQGVFRGSGPRATVAFLYPGQGSQYVNMLRPLSEREPIVAATFAEADAIATPLLGKALTGFLFADNDPAAIERAEDALKQTSITQPAVLTVDLALTRLLAAYGLVPDMVMGHSLGEYGALQAAGALPFADAVEAVSARGREMTRVAVADQGRMAAVFAPIPEIERILRQVDGYVVIANVNSRKQAVIGGATAAVEQAVPLFQQAGYTAVPLPVSHAFHTSIVAPATEPMRRQLARLRLSPPKLPIVANVTGGFYPSNGGSVPEMLDLLARQVAAPVQFVKGLSTLYDAGARVFVEVGPKKALQGFVDDAFGDDPEVVALFTNHPKLDDAVAFNLAVCGLYAAGHGDTAARETAAAPGEARPVAIDSRPRADAPVERPAEPAAVSHAQHVVITGAAMGLPGTEKVFDDENVARMLRGEQLIDAVPMRVRRAMVDKRITRLVKTEDGSPRFDVIDSTGAVVKLAARAGRLDLTAEFGVPAERVAALDTTTALAIAAGLEAMRDAGLPLVLHYKTTSRGTKLPDRWGLPESLRDETGVIFASAFPGCDSFASELTRHYTDRARREQLAALESVRVRLNGSPSDASEELDRRIAELRSALERDPYVFDRRFLMRVLAMGHSQFAELVGARGPNTQVNAACASTTQAITLADDWIRLGRCRRVIVISADNVTSDNLLDWMGSGFLASGAAATDDVIEEAALPFDRRRHGLIVGMGAAAVVVESRAAARERGLQPICELLASVTANSAYHGTRLNVDHIGRVMESLVREAEVRWGIDRREIAPHTVFVSHETYTPARGGSASAEVHALRQVFGEAADAIVVANTKGYTGHAMGAGIEDVTAIKVLETGLVPPVANFKEVDPELGPLNLSAGGAYPVRYALRLAAGFGSQVSMSLLRWVPTVSGVRQQPHALGHEYRLVDRRAWQQWLAAISGQRAPELEVVSRTLRVRDSGAGAATALNDAATRVREPVISTPAPVGVAATVAVASNPEPAPAAPTPAPAPVPQPAAAARTSERPVTALPVAGPAAPRAPGEVRDTIVRLVVEKTGYPADMLDLDLDLEADLGVDTVKQAELLAAIRGIYNIPRDESLKLRDFPTLNHVIRFVIDRRPDLQGSPASAAVAAEPVAAVATPLPEATSAPGPEPKLPDTTSDARDTIVMLVVEKTGYPADMLDVDLDLEADLGVDTVKQAELLAAIRGIYNIPRDDSLKLRDFPTLRHMIEFVTKRWPEPPKPAVPAGTTPATHEPAPVPAVSIAEPEAPPPPQAVAADAVPRRVPVPKLYLPLQLCKPTGVALGPGSRVIIGVDQGGVADAIAATLSARGVQTLVLDTTLDADALGAVLSTWVAAGSIDGVFWLPALDIEGDFRTMTFEGWRRALHARVRMLHVVARALYGQFESPGRFLVVGTRLGGQHGCGREGATAPLGGAVTGFAKAFSRERPDAVVKAVDFEAGAQAPFVADRLVGEALHDPSSVEIGYNAALRWTIGLDEVPPDPETSSGPTLSRDTVFVVSGAAGSIVSAITADLAAASGGTFFLLDRIPEPDPANTEIPRLAADREGLKRDIAERLKERGEKATPAAVERELASLERSSALLTAMASITAAGGAAKYLQADLTDGDSVARAIDVVRAEAGRIDVLIHAAGLDASHLLPDKTPAEFDVVFGVKSDGWFHLLHAIGDLPLGATVVFSSIAGRFGNAGQTDYAAANDLLSKLTSSFRRTRPGTRAIAIDWTGWKGIGMASRGSIPKLLEQAGIEMLPPEAGIPVVRRELTRTSATGEVVVALGLGGLLRDRDSNGGLDAREWPSGSHPGPAIGVLTGMRDGVLTVQTTLDPAEQPFLQDHRIEGTAVLPGVMGLEAFAEAAALAAPGWIVGAVEDVTFASALKFYRNQPRTFTIEARFAPDGDDLVADCRLLAVRQRGGHESTQVYFTGRVRLVRRTVDLGFDDPPARPEAVIGASDIYHVYFHGPAYRVLGEAWRAEGAVVGLVSGALPPNHVPAGRRTLVSPRLIEACFQAAGLLELEASGRIALPHGVEYVSAATGDECALPLHAVVHPGTTEGSFDALVVDASGRVRVVLRGYRTIAMPGAPEETAVRDAFARLKAPVAVLR